MNIQPIRIRSGAIHVLLVALLGAGFALSGPAFANHTVLVEGEKDFDGDGVVGMSEDSDGDQVFGSIQAGVNGVGANGRVLIVTSGRFFEQVVINAAGVVVLEAAPGVAAIVEAFNAGDAPANNNRRQQQPGIIVNNGDFPVEIRNITSRNWTEGIRVMGSADVTIDHVRVDSNVNYGIRVIDSNVAVTDSQVNSSGFRLSGTLGPTPGGDVMPNPGIGISFQGRSTGFVANTLVAHSFAAGIDANRRGRVKLFENVVFNNGDDGRGRGYGRRDDDRRGRR